MQYLQSNTTLQGGKYRIERVLGQGGFGITYRAIMRDSVSGKLGAMEIEVPVAIKEFFMKDTCLRNEGSSFVTVPSTGSKNLVEQYRKKFVKEANNLSNLNHPNIVQVIDVFQENGTDYYVMEYLEGGSLRDVVKREGKLDEKRALGYIALIGYALSYMHTDKHLCHYDVKPGNIVLDKKGTPKLIDFGISKNYDSEGNQTSSTPIGISEGFAPLEQYKQSVQEFSPQTDVYALGATLYYLLCGKVPPEASDVVNDGLPSLPYTISKSIRDAIEQAMQPRKKDRPQTMKEFLELVQGKEGTSSFTHEKPNPAVPAAEAVAEEVDEETYFAQEGVYSDPLPNNPPPKPGTHPSAPKPKVEKIGEEKSNTGAGKSFIAYLIAGVCFFIGIFVMINDMDNSSNNTPTVVSTSAVQEVQNMAFKSGIGNCSYSGPIDENNKPHGRGTAKFSDGREYYGFFLHGILEGEDVLFTYGNGDRFEGTFKNNSFNQGKYTIKSDGSYFTGTFLGGKPSKGTWYDKSGNVLEKL